MNKLRYFREQTSLTQNELGEKCGFSYPQSRVSMYESGARTPNLNIARTIIAALNEKGAECTLDDVFPPTPGTGDEQAA